MFTMRDHIITDHGAMDVTFVYGEIAAIGYPVPYQERRHTREESLARKIAKQRREPEPPKVKKYGECTGCIYTWPGTSNPRYPFCIDACKRERQEEWCDDLYDDGTMSGRMRRLKKVMRDVKE